MSHEPELPNLAEVIGRVLQRVPAAEQPLLIAAAERLAAERYRRWAREAPDRSTGLLACAGREEEIARRVESLYPDAAAVERRLLDANPDPLQLHHPLLAGFSPPQPWTLPGQGERLGAATWRAFAGSPATPDAARETLLACALLEEESAAFLESLR